MHGESFVVIHPTNCCYTDRHVADSIGLEELKRSLVQQSHILLLTKRVATLGIVTNLWCGYFEVK